VSRATTYGVLSILGAATVVIAAVAYAEIVYTYDLTTLIVSVITPLALGSFLINLRRSRVMLYAYLAFIWAVLDDRPIFFDSFLTWPEVTRFHPFLPRLFMNIVIHGLTLVFLYLSVREASKLSKTSFWRSPLVLVLAAIFLVLAYAQNIPLSIVQDVVQAGSNPASWYPFDLITKLLALLFLYVTLSEAARPKRNSQSRIIGYGEPGISGQQLPRRQEASAFQRPIRRLRSAPCQRGRRPKDAACSARARRGPAAPGG